MFHINMGCMWKRNRCKECRNNPRPGQRTCLKCHARYLRKWRAGHDLSPKARKAMNARSYAHVYLKRGKLKKRPCQRCGSKKSQMHHPNYDKPLMVHWLCRKCHLRLHRRAKM